MSDPNDDPVLNCILEVCCLAGSESQTQALANLIGRDCGLGRIEAMNVSQYMLGRFDLAEKGTLQAFKKSIVRVHGAQ